VVLLRRGSLQMRENAGRLQRHDSRRLENRAAWQAEKKALSTKGGYRGRGEEKCLPSWKQSSRRGKDRPKKKKKTNITTAPPLGGVSCRMASEKETRKKRSSEERKIFGRRTRGETATDRREGKGVIRSMGGKKVSEPTNEKGVDVCPGGGKRSSSRERS